MARKPIKRIDKLLGYYIRAQGALMRERDRLFPEGTIVRNVDTGCTHTVTRGSWYADQVHLDGNSHSSWNRLEIVSKPEKK